ncbi:MAG: thioredoxin family protein [Thermoguttaceae bacterium]
MSSIRLSFSNISAICAVCFCCALVGCGNHQITISTSSVSPDDNILSSSSVNQIPNTVTSRNLTSRSKNKHIPHNKNSHSKDEVIFMSDYASALEQAEASNKPLLVFFYAPNCVFSKQMLDDAFSDKRVVNMSKQFICVAVDVDTNSRLCKKLGVKGMPTVQFMSPQGNLIQCLTAQKTSEQLLSQMQLMIQSFALNRQQTRR